MNKKVSKKEKKLLKAAKRLEKATAKYMEELAEIDEIFENLPTKVTRKYSLDDKYFRIVPTVASAAVKFELLYSYILSEIGDLQKEIPIWDLEEHSVTSTKGKKNKKRS